MPTSRFRMALRTRARRYLILSHRYLGICISLMLVVWFASGIVMMYAGGMPRLDPQLRLSRLPAMDFARVEVSAAQATERVPAGHGPPTLSTLQGRPAWRFAGGNIAVFADDGTVLQPLDVAAATEVASRFAGVPATEVRLERQLDEPDQWTLGSRRQHSTLLKFQIEDGRGTEVYVSPQAAEVVQMTTRRTRALAWIGTIPHWLYFASIRVNQPVWYRLVVGLSSAACVLAVLGLILAWTQFRRSRPFRLAKSVPYRGGMRWHYISGTLFGVFALTWAFSGLMSMEPWDWTNARGLRIDRDALAGGNGDGSLLSQLDGDRLAAAAAPRIIKEVGLQYILGRPYFSLQTSAAEAPEATRAERLHQPYAVGGRGEDGHVLVDAGTFEKLAAALPVDVLVRAVQAAVPGHRILDQQLLNDYDSYYYSRRRQTVLPVLRLKFDDPMQSWIYIDPRTAGIVAQVHKYSRIERWLYNGLHSLDFKFWYGRRPLWDIGMILLLGGGLVSSGIGLYLGLKRLLRGLRRPRPAGTVAERA